MAKRLAGNRNALDIRKLKRDGCLIVGRISRLIWTLREREIASIQLAAKECSVTLSYQTQGADAEWQKKEYSVQLEWTDCHLGGGRVWFRCPANGCGRRAAILFSGSIFACRHCHKLAYASQREAKDDRAMRRADKIRKRLGWPVGIANPLGDKPKGMHWRTYGRLINEYHCFAQAAWYGTAQRMNLLEHQLVG